jgi:hypothetical protein
MRDSQGRVHGDAYMDLEMVLVEIKKKSQGVDYYFKKEAVSSGTIRIAKKDSEVNLADLSTKLLTKERRDFWIGGSTS